MKETKDYWIICSLTGKSYIKLGEKIKFFVTPEEALKEIENNYGNSRYLTTRRWLKWKL